MFGAERLTSSSCYSLSVLDRSFYCQKHSGTWIAARGSELPRIYQLILVDNGSYVSAQAEIQWKHILTLITKMQSNYFEMHSTNTTVLYASVYNNAMSNIIDNN
jgi:hypothetical protein